MSFELSVVKKNNKIKKKIIIFLILILLTHMFVSNSTASSEPAQVESPPPAAPRVQGSATRKVRSRVHGGVKEPRARLLFAPPPPAPRFLPTGGCAPAATAASPRHSPQRRTTCLCCASETFPRQENSGITTSVGAADERFAALLGSRTILLFPASTMWSWAACLYLYRKSENSAQTRSSWTILQDSNSKTVKTV